MWAAQHYRWSHPQSMVIPGGLGYEVYTMGFGLPAAIGAKIAAPHKTVVDIVGDASFSITAMASFSMTATELATGSQYGKVLVLNNEFQGIVLQWQDLFYDARHSHTNPDFVALAKAMGVQRETAAELPAKMAELPRVPRVSPSVLWSGMGMRWCVAAGKTLHESILHPSLRAVKAA
ncbi:thiamine diphosphate-binding protein [Mycena filopes]|nr:thiamine diphosphate-binding protein [Mycena filopes]